MVYTSLPSYLNPPNWNQQQEQSHHHHHQQAGGNGGVVGSSGGGVESHQLPLQLPPRPEASTVASAARPNSMADRARHAKLPQPDQALKCPRCDSTNTKFCYYNNYSLSQPRHFCKTCRRYWTRGGALRNVPVGGGCRRNKRSKSSSSKSTSTESKAGTSLAGAMSGNRGGGGGGGGAINSNITPPQLHFLAPLNSLADYGAAAAGIGLNFNFSGIPTVDPVDYQVGSSSGVGLEQWRSAQQVQQFPLFAGLESTPATATTVGMYQFDGEVMVDAAAFPGRIHGKASASASGFITHDSSVKMEENPQRLNLPKQYLDMPGNGQYSWGGNNGGGNGSGSGSGSGTIVGSSGTTGGPGWTDMVSFNSSTTGSFL